MTIMNFIYLKTPYRIVSSIKYLASLLLEIEVGSLFTLKIEAKLNLSVHTEISI